MNSPEGGGGGRRGEAPGRESSPLQATDLTCGYPGRPIVAALDVRLEPGEALAVVGPNGAGKTTLVRTLAGLTPPLEGRVLLGGVDLGELPPLERARRVAVLPQEIGDAEDLTVRELVELGRTPHLGLWGTPAAADRHAVETALRACQLEQLADRRLGEVSGGERQRARIALAVAQDAPLLLLDEPASHLDLRRRHELFELLGALRRDRRLALLIVLHDLAEAYREADRVLVLAAGRGRVLLADDPDRREKLAQAFEVPVERINL
jgi:iron complex transport system ATP-binding protein